MNRGAIRWTLLIVILLPASWAAFGAVSGTAACVMVLAAAAYFWVGDSRWKRSIRAFAVLLGLSALLGLFMPAVQAAREDVRCMQCRNNLKQIAVGVQCYHDHYGCYPLPCTLDQAGRAMHSWRLLILPYITSQNVDGHYNRNEPWDSPGNKKALEEFGHAFRCPTAGGWLPRSTTTNYVAVVGRRPAWRQQDASQKNLDAQQQKADTFLIVEMANSAIPWSEPKDIYLDDLSTLRSVVANSPHRRSNGYFFRKTPAINAILIDGDMMFLFPRDSTPNVITSLKLLLPPDPTEAERKVTKANYLDSFYKEHPPPIHWPHLIGLPVWIVGVALVSYQAIVASRRQGRVIL